MTVRSSPLTLKPEKLLLDLNKTGSKQKVFDLQNRILIMGVLNLTPDSFYDGGRYIKKEEAIKKACSLVNEGADILDIGAESTRPGALKLSEQEERDRLIPVLKALRKRIRIPLSVDTYKSEIARAALDEGCDIINDISGLGFDKKMAPVISAYRAGLVIMHMKGTPRTMQKNPAYRDLITEIKNFFKKSLKIALEKGINYDKIILDPGIGFGKTVEHNYSIINRLSEFKTFKRPVLIGVSRKSLIGKVLDQSAEERLLGTIVLNTVSILKGANIIRVHDVKEHKDLLRLLKFLKTKGTH
ncbi:MAG: dihydropteroate synthase [Spirochaetes bacterium]|nr:dihydropteroate synthase [Spirochaetota bacterium]